MPKDPAILFYTSDFITGTLTMTDEQRGKYIILLCLQHQQGYLKEEDMLNICKTYDKKVYSKFKKDNEGNYYNIRMKLESDKRKKYSESRRKNRMNISKTYDKHMENENIKKGVQRETKDKDELLLQTIDINPEYKNIFLRWLKYKRANGKSYKNKDSLKTAYEKLIALSKNNPKTANKIVEQSLANNWAGLFELKMNNQ